MHLHKNDVNLGSLHSLGRDLCDNSWQLIFLHSCREDLCLGSCRANFSLGGKVRTCPFIIFIIVVVAFYCYFLCFNNDDFIIWFMKMLFLLLVLVYWIFESAFWWDSYHVVSFRYGAVFAERYFRPDVSWILHCYRVILKTIKRKKSYI